MCSARRFISRLVFFLTEVSCHVVWIMTETSRSEISLPSRLTRFLSRHAPRLWSRDSSIIGLRNYFARTANRVMPVIVLGENRGAKVTFNLSFGLIYISLVYKPFLCVAFIFRGWFRLPDVANDVFEMKNTMFLILWKTMCCKLWRRKTRLQHHEKINEKKLARKILTP